MPYLCDIMKNLAFIALMSLLAISIHAQTAIRRVDAATFKSLIDQKKYVLIDLRTDEEIKSKGMIKGAQQINFLAKDAEQIIEKLDRNKAYLIYCAGGGRSGECAELMQKLGFREVIDLEKGYDDWKRRGLETVQRK